MATRGCPGKSKLSRSDCASNYWPDALLLPNPQFLGLRGSPTGRRTLGSRRRGKITTGAFRPASGRGALADRSSSGSAAERRVVEGRGLDSSRRRISGGEPEGSAPGASEPAMSCGMASRSLSAGPGGPFRP